MRKTLLTILMMLFCGQFFANAQAIEAGDRFWDGSTLFTVREIRMGNIVYMTDAIGDLELTLEAWPEKKGKYTLRPSRNAEEAPYGADFGTHIDYISQPDNKYLIIYGDNDTVAQVLYQVQPMQDSSPSGLWYNGALVYSASASENGSVLNAMAEGEEHEFLLAPVAADGDLFEVSSSLEVFVNEYEDALYARRIRQDGLDVICFYNKRNILIGAMELTQVEDAQELNIQKWMALLRGEYKSEGGKDVVIDDFGGSYNGRPMPFNAVTFNGMVTGVLDFGSDGPYLAGKVEAVPTPDGLQLTEVKMNEGEPWYEKTVSYFKLKWTGSGSRFDFTGKELLTGVLHSCDKALLRVMRNAILAQHGYVFKSKDLKAYFEAQPWYKPAPGNAGIELSLLEHLNLQLIQAAEKE